MYFKFLAIFGLGFLLSVPLGTLQAQSTYEPIQSHVSAEVIEIEEEKEESIAGTSASSTVQTINAEITEGPEAGKIVSFENDITILAPGDKIFLDHVRTINGDEFYQLRDVNRQGGLVLLGILFVVLLVLFAGRQGVKALLSLSASILAIVFLLVPALLNGYDPTLSSFVIAILVLALVLFGTHGFNATAVLAFLGTSAAVLVTSLVSWWFVHELRLTGFSGEGTVALNFATNGSLDFTGLLLGSIIIGMLGVLDDVAITQASVVRELKAVNDKLKTKELYQRAIRVGRDHVGSLVNTLALAYVGAALPLVLLFSTSEAAIGVTLNREIISAEIARIILGSIGIILAVPFTTYISAKWFSTRMVDPQEVTGHSHHH